MNQVKKEIRRILCGQYNDDGVVIRAADGFFKSDRSRLNSAVLRLRLLGVMCVTSSYTIKSKHPSLVCADVMSLVGRVTELVTAPDDVCMLHESYVRFPYLIAARLEKNTLQLRLFAPRSFFSLFRGIRTLKQIGKMIEEYKPQ